MCCETLTVTGKPSHSHSIKWFDSLGNFAMNIIILLSVVWIVCIISCLYRRVCLMTWPKCIASYVVMNIINNNEWGFQQTPPLYIYTVILLQLFKVWLQPWKSEKLNPVYNCTFGLIKLHAKTPHVFIATANIIIIVHFFFLHKHNLWLYRAFAYVISQQKLQLILQINIIRQDVLTNKEDSTSVCNQTVMCTVPHE